MNIEKLKENIQTRLEDIAINTSLRDQILIAINKAIDTAVENTDQVSLGIRFLNMKGEEWNKFYEGLTNEQKTELSRFWD
jgi:hypothetical protein